jgi:hypothetical protein
MGKGKKVAAVDFDGVIHKYGNGWQKGIIYDETVPGAKDGVQALKDAGFYILIYTTRTNPQFRRKGEPEQYDQLVQYLEKNEIPYDQIYVGSGKPMADIYLDDRAIPFTGDWNKAVELATAFKPWNRPDAKSSAELNSISNKGK